MTEIVLPDEAWQGVEPGTEALMDQWRVREGDRVAAGQALGNVVLVKTNIELTAPADGVVERILVPAQANFGRGKVLAVLREDS